MPITASDIPYYLRSDQSDPLADLLPPSVAGQPPIDLAALVPPVTAGTAAQLPPASSTFLERLRDAFTKPMKDLLPADDPARTQTPLAPSPSALAVISKFLNTPLKDFNAKDQPSTSAAVSAPVVPVAAVSGEPIQSPFAGGQMPDVPTAPGPSPSISAQRFTPTIIPGLGADPTATPPGIPAVHPALSSAIPATTSPAITGGGGDTAPAAQDPWKAFLAQRADAQAALAAAQGRAKDARDWQQISNTFRASMDTFLGRRTDEAAAQARLNDAYNLPLNAFQASRTLNQDALKNFAEEQETQQKLLGQAIGQRMLMLKADPNSRISQYERATFGQYNPNYPPELLARMSAQDIEAVSPQMKAVSDIYAKSAEGKASLAAAGKTGVETGQIAADAASKRALEAAQAEQARASARLSGAEAEQKGGATVTPGWVKTGQVPLSDKQREDFIGEKTAVDIVNRKVDEITGILGDSNFALDSKKRAQLTPKVQGLLFDLKKAENLRGLPQADINVINGIVGDPTSLTPANILGWTHNAIRLGEFARGKRADLADHAKNLGIVPEPNANTGVAHYRSQLAPGERMIRSQAGQFGAIKPGETVPSGWTVVD